MASPRILIQILITGTQIFGKALKEAGKQAVKNAKSSPQGAIGGDVAGVGNATSGSVTDNLTRQHRMTLDEAHLILNAKRAEEMEVIIKNYEHLFKANSPAEPAAGAPKLTTKGKQPQIPSNSHYLQSKVVRAKERIEAELKASEQPPPPNANPPPPDAPPSGPAT